jgi:5-methylcytosine-specific restriction protein B
MESQELKSYKFSEKTFALISELSQDYNDPEEIEKSDKYHTFREYVETPFQIFCEEVARKLSPYCCISSIEKVKQPNNYEVGLIANFSRSKLLFIKITQWGIKTGINYQVYTQIIEKSARERSAELMDLISRNPDYLSHSSLDIKNNNLVLNQGFQVSADKVTEWFKKYIPLLILDIISDDYLTLINHLYPNHLYPKLKINFDDWHKTGFSEKELQCWIHTINRKKQVIFYGSPGTGKTFIAEKIAKHLISKGNGFCELVQFHPAYTYEDFIQGIRPQSEDGKLTYPLVPGKFLEFCKKAEICQDICVLIIDEINRANLPQVFGELMYLLEYRDQEIPLAGGNKFRIPENVRIIGTMNTADRSIAQIDHALRRRFAFIELRPNYDVLIKYHENTDFAVMDLINVLKRLNHTIDDKNYEIGISFFLTPNLREDIEDIWKMEIEPYLEEYFFNNLEKVDEFRWDKIQKDLKI